jgi:hypothetical protein
MNRIGITVHKSQASLFYEKRISVNVADMAQQEREVAIA